jgi:acyl carrier protein
MLTVASSKKIYRLKKLNMNKEETLEQLRDIIKPYINSEEGFENFTENTDFISDLNINSANLVDIILDVEDHFKIHIDNESMEKW